MQKVISRRTFFTGKAMNVAAGLSRIGAHAVASGFMYEENGRLFEQEMHKQGVTYKFVWNKGRVKEVYKFIDRRSMLTEVVDEATPIDKDNAEQLIQMVADMSKSCQAVVFTGDLSRGLPEDYMCKVLSTIPDNVLKIVDTDGARMVKLLEYGVDLVKPNLSELSSATNLKITDKDSMIKACEALVAKGAKRVLLSLGKQGAVICDGKRRLYCTSLNVAMNTTAGAGDAMVAAATKALCEGADLSDILRCGVAAGTASVTLPDSISFLREKYEEILNMVTVKEI
ncbi:MAG: bifunctional hydroxymethylpyrimidine kinase/phosphomethylpyrimidine kinase [Clostridia bacterium]|nr:bifunctional hydroxymethylpyrimidine kinase/phosphomethylpyrimidine kinase [Clostridia bacterium]